MRALVLVLAMTSSVSDSERVHVPGGETVMGHEHAHHDDEKPVHTVRVSPFDMDATLVTVARFRAWIAESHFVTDAERAGYGMVAWEGLPDWEWKAVGGATWRAPFGPKGMAGFTLDDNQPVTQVSWSDAHAFCAEQHGRLPTEAEWEHAMRAGKSGVRFPWGDDVKHNGAYGLNFWQAESHAHGSLDDGYLYLSPVRAYPPNAWGLYDPVGNAWQYTADWYASDAYAVRARDVVAVDPKGPSIGARKVTRGGSWWCSLHACAAFGLYARGKSEPHATVNNVAFRCVYDR
jgi:formylglycine-generating enzyme required for sulfatase activity